MIFKGGGAKAPVPESNPVHICIVLARVFVCFSSF